MPLSVKGSDTDELRQCIENLRLAVYQTYKEQGETFTSEEILRLSRKLDRLMNDLYLAQQRAGQVKRKDDNDNDGAPI